MADEQGKTVLVQLVDKVLGWLKKAVPTALILAIYRRLKRKIWRTEREVEMKQLEIRHHENKEKVTKDNLGKSDADIIHDAVAEGESIRKAGSD